MKGLYATDPTTQEEAILRIDKGSPGDAAHLGICIHNYGSWISILYIL